MTPYKPRTRRQIEKIVAAKIALEKHVAAQQAAYRMKRTDEREALAREADVKSLMRSAAFSREEAESVVDQVDADSGLTPIARRSLRQSQT